MLAGVQEGGATGLRTAASFGEVTKRCDIVMQQPPYPQQSGEDTEVCSETLQVWHHFVLSRCLYLGTRSTAELRPYRTEQEDQNQTPLGPEKCMSEVDGFATWLEAGRESGWLWVWKGALQRASPMCCTAMLEKTMLRPRPWLMLYLQLEQHACILQQGNGQLQ